mgnify:FL=1|jgi:hypothetical protein
MKLREFYEYFQLINLPQEVRADCNSLTVINTGTATAVLDGLEIAPGAQYYAPGNEDEFNTTRYRLSFTGVGTEIVTVIRKLYK